LSLSAALELVARPGKEEKEGNGGSVIPIRFENEGPFGGGECCCGVARQKKLLDLVDLFCYDVPV
jgi:hypothetical protein